MTFEEATDRLRAFAADQGLAGEIGWVFREDVLLRGWRGMPRAWLRWPLPAANHRLARRLFDGGEARGLGVLLTVSFRSGPDLLAHVCAPRDQADAESALLGPGLKLSIARPIGEARRIPDGPAWWIIGRLQRARGDDTDMPSRADLSP
jgi:hypothetical protein